MRALVGLHPLVRLGWIAACHIVRGSEAFMRMPSKERLAARCKLTVKHAGSAAGRMSNNYALILSDQKSWNLTIQNCNSVK